MHPFWITFIVFAIFLTAESIASLLFIRKSRNNYPVLWKDAGCPTILGDSDLISAWKTNRYLLKRDYLKIEDETGRQFAERMRFPMLAGYFGAWGGALLFVTSFMFFGKP